MHYALSSSLGSMSGLNTDKLALDLQFATDKTLTARRGPTPTFTRASTATFVGSDGLIQSAAINAPRFDHDPITLACKGLLIEEQRTNLISFSEAINNVAWNAFATASATDNQTTSPSGVALSASRVTANAGTSTTRIRPRIVTITTGGTSYSVSAFVKAGASDFGLVSMGFNKSGIGVIRNCDAHIVFSTGVVTKTGASNANFTVVSTPYPDGWYRITISATSNASTLTEDQVVLSVGLSFDGLGGSGVFAGTETVFAWGGQIEAGSFPTSYIPTTTASVVRSADVCSITGAAFSGMYNATEGTVFADVVTPDVNQAASIYYMNTAAGQNANSIFKLNSSLNADGKRWTYFSTNAAGVLQAQITTPTDVAILRSKVASAYKINDFVFVHAGTIIGTDTSGTLPTPNQMGIGSRVGGSLILNGHIASLRYYKKRVSNSRLQTITT